jgi:hypothetical protein
LWIGQNESACPTKGCPLHGCAQQNEESKSVERVMSKLGFHLDNMISDKIATQAMRDKHHSLMLELVKWHHLLEQLVSNRRNVGTAA